MSFNGVITKKITILYNVLEELEKYKQLNIQDLENDFMLKKGIERSLQICSEAVIDIAHRIVHLKKDRPVESASMALELLQKMKVIRSSSKYKKMIQFRNFIVHRYEFIDNEIIISILKNNLKDYYDFIKEIENFEN